HIGEWQATQVKPAQARAAQIQPAAAALRHVGPLDRAAAVLVSRQQPLQVAACQLHAGEGVDPARDVWLDRAALVHHGLALGIDLGLGTPRLMPGAPVRAPGGAALSLPPHDCVRQTLLLRHPPPPCSIALASITDEALRENLPHANGGGYATS